MKKILLLVTAFMLLSIQGFSQFGIKGGLNFNSFEDINLGKDANFKTIFEERTGYHIGLLYRVKVPVIGLAVQPELLYSKTLTNISISDNSSNSASGNIKITYLQLPVALQWGIDLMLFRPFIQAVPYLGYSFAHSNSLKNLEWDVTKLRYGVGLGAGLDIWKLQISGKYSWDLGKATEFNWQGIRTFKGGKSNGFELSLAILF